MAKVRPSRATSGQDYTTKKVSFGLFSLEFDENNQEAQTAVILEQIENSKEFMDTLAETMKAMIVSNIESGSHRGLSETTIKKKTSLGQPLQPLVATGALRDNLQVKTRKGYAAVKRGQEEWYAFLQHLGVGRLDARPFMEFDAAQSNQIFGMIEKFFDDALEGK